MSHPNEPCPTCAGRDINQEGIRLARTEVLPFFKGTVLHLRYTNHPFPVRFGDLTNSLFAYSQALAHARAHQEPSIYYTPNKWLLKHAAALEERFGLLTLRPAQEAPAEVRIACEFNEEQR